MNTLTLEQAAELYRIIMQLSEQIREDWKDGSAYNRRGDCYEQLGNYEFALQDYSSAIEHEPHLHHYTDRARLYLAMGRYTECIADCEQAFERGKLLSERWGTSYVPFTPAVLIKTEAEKMLKEKEYEV